MYDFVSSFRKKVKRRELRIAVIGLGYVGLPLAAAFAQKGFCVLGIDIDKDRLQRLKRKDSYITDVSNTVLDKIMRRGKFEASRDFGRLKEIDAVIICVPTPLKRKYHPDISYVKQAVKQIAKNMKPSTLVILESTTYPGTTEEVILPLLKYAGKRHNRDFYLGFSPERIDPGNKTYAVEKIPKIVGGVTKEAANLAVALYAEVIDKVIPVSSARVAEFVKLLENTFRLVNIGMIDELAMMADKMGINIWEVIEAAKTKPFGFMPFYPGPGVGGHCIPKDPLYLYWKARKFGFKSRFIKLASDIIAEMPNYVVERLKKALQEAGKDLRKSKILVVGVTYKRDVKDLRKSPALDIIEILHAHRAGVHYFDPLIPYLKWGSIDLKSIEWGKNSLGKYDCALVVTDHSSVDYDFLLQNSRLLFDMRNVYKGVKNRKVFRL